MIMSKAASFAANILKTREEIVWRVDGDSLAGAHYWSYVAVEKLKFPAFREALDSGNIKVQNYGKILAWGVGEAPPDGIKQHIKEHYGFDIED